MSSPTPSVSLSEAEQGQVAVHGDEIDDYSQDFEQEQEEQDGHVLDRGGGNMTKTFSFEDEDSVQVSDVDLELSHSVMSTILEEIERNTPSNAELQYYRTTELQVESPESRVPEELKGLTHHFQGGDVDDDENVEDNSASHQESPMDKDEDEEEEDETGIEALLKKLQMLENTQNLLENVLDANNSSSSVGGGGGSNTVEEILQQALAQLNTATAQTPRRRQQQDDKDHGDDDDKSETDTSLRQEVNSLRKLLDLTLDEDTAPGTPAKSGGGGRQVEEVLQEYEELERSLQGSAAAAAAGKSFDDQELSFRSDASAVASSSSVSISASKSKPAPPHPLPPQFPWNENIALEEEFKSEQKKNIDKKLREQEFISQQPHPQQIEHEKATLLDPNQFIRFPESSAMEEERSRTKTLPKKKIPSSPFPTKSASTTSISPKNLNNKGSKSPYLSSSNSARPHSHHQQQQSVKTSQSTGSLMIVGSSSGRASYQSQQQKEQSTGERRMEETTKGEGDRRNQSIYQEEEGESLGNWKLRQELQQEKEQVVKLGTELQKQEALLQAYQEDNQKLYGALKGKESDSAAKEGEWEELVNSLKTEIATLKIQRFVGSPSRSRPGSGANANSSSTPSATPTHQQQQQLKAEVERLKEESAHKSQQMIELRKEIIGLRNELSEAQKKVKTPSKNVKLQFQEKEKEYQKQVKGLTRQVRTLQKILYNKDPSHPQSYLGGGNLSRDDALYSSQELLLPAAGVTNNNNANANNGQITVLENRVVELERNLAKADQEGRDRLKDFQTRLNSLKSKYEDQLQETELLLQESDSKLKLAQNSTSSSALAELSSRLEKSTGDVTHLKQELGRARRELEIAAKSSLPPPQTAKGDASTLSLAIKSFKSELAEKERECCRLKKDLGELQRTNGTLKREREKYLGLGGLQPRIVSRIQQSGGSGNVNIGLGGRGGQADYFGGGGTSSSVAKKEKRDGNMRLGSPKRGGTAPSSSTVEVLQETLDYERAEFEELLGHKKKEIEEKDKMIKKLRQQLKHRIESGDDNPDHHHDSEGVSSAALRKKDLLLAELSSRLTAQNELILRFKETLSHYRGLEEELTRCRQELGSASTHIAQLYQKLQLAQEFSRPENEILSLLAEKFESLNARYLQREQQMESLLNQLAARTGAGAVSSHPHSLQNPIPTNQTTYSSSYSGGGPSGIRSENWTCGGGGIAKQQTMGSGIIEQLLKMGVTSTASSGELDLRQLSPSLYGHLFSAGGGCGNLRSDIPEV